jgi:uncharacterized protein (DUF885 family)
MHELHSVIVMSCVALWIAAVAGGQPDSRPGEQVSQEGGKGHSLSAGAEATRVLHQLFSEYFEWQLHEHPEMAMSRGDYRFADRITDQSLDVIELRQRSRKRFLTQLGRIDKSLLDEQDRVSAELLELEITNAIKGHEFRTFLMPMGGRSGPQQDVPQMSDRVRFATKEDYENYLLRLGQVPEQVENVTARMRLGMKEGRTPAKVTLEGLPMQLKAVVDGGGLNELATPLNRMPQEIPAESQRELKRRFDEEVLPAVRDSLTRFGDFVTREYIPACRESIAAIDLPEGEAYYNHQLKVMTTTDMTAREIHELGLREVARIRAEMMQVIRRSDFMAISPGAGDLPDDQLFKSFIHYLRTDPRFYYTEEEALLAGYRDICKRVDAWLPKLFVTLPRLPYGVRPVPKFMAPTQTTAYYEQGDIRNAEPGYFAANTYALDQRPKYEMIPLALHEAVPGHHLQIALAQEIEGLPEFRKDAYFVVFGEGWALYAERLGIEMGLFKDPYDDFGRLLYEMWRACRLVVDPGMHALGWSRDQAIQFMLDNTALSPLNIENEIDRYINWPGQACGYKIGELKIRELRAHAEESLGQQFDLRAFHDVILGQGAVPLNVLERRVNDWIRSEQDRGTS